MRWIKAGSSGGETVRRFDFVRLNYNIKSATYKIRAPQNVLQLVLQNLVAIDPIPDKLGNGNAPGWLTGGVEEVHPHAEAHRKPKDA